MSKRALSPDQEDLAIEQFKGGQSMASIAKGFGISPANIRRLVKARGLTTRWREAVTIVASKDDLIYLAGFFDGEGSVMIYRTTSAIGTPRHCLRLSIGNSDHAVLEWIRDTFGGRLHYDHNRLPQHLDFWIWATSPRQSLGILRLLQPYVRVKKAQVDAAIEFQEHINSRLQSLANEGKSRCAPSQDDIDYREALKARMDVSKGQRFRSWPRSSR